jgi:tetratricopeptide (TPR) repeat protein
MTNKYKHEAPLPTRLYTGALTRILEEVIGFVEEMGPSNKDCKNRAEKAERERDYKTAAKYYEKLGNRLIKTAYQDPSEYLIKAAEDWEKLGKNKKALKCYQKIVERGGVHLGNKAYAERMLKELKKK